jgi:eukaryotic-like serine/threonine-protein kinase
VSEEEFGGTDRFEIVRRLGAGGMGVVYEAIDRQRRVPVALKMLTSIGGQDLLQFKREFRALQDVQHPNLISLGELYEHHGQWFFTMELLRGVEIVAYVRPAHVAEEPRSVGIAAGADGTVVSAGGSSGDDDTVALSSRSPSSRVFGVRSALPRLDESRLRAALTQLTQALMTLHAAGKVHRDIKPSNILVTPEGRVVLLDFGLVAEVIEAGQHQHRLAGTIPYMAPESLFHSVGPEADWYGVGVLLYVMLTGQLPFDGRPTDILLRKQNERPPPPHEVADGVPEDLDRLCVDLLERVPARRPKGGEVLRRLQKSTRALTSLFPPPSRASGVFVGRERELAALAEGMAEARAGKTITILLRGESGIGKTALVRRLVEETESGAIVLSGRCYEREAVPYKAVDGVIDALSHLLARLPEDELAELVPRNADLLPLVFPVLRRIAPFGAAPSGAPGALDPHAMRLRAFAALRDLLTRLGDRQPLLVTIDDIQWADADSFALLSELLRPPGGPAMLLVATLRTRDEAENDLGLPGDVRHLRLQSLSDSESLTLARALVEDRPGMADPSSVAEEAAGHPMFITELARHARRATGTSSLRLDDVLRARVIGLPAEAQRLLEVVSLAGAPVPEDVLARAALADPADFHRYLAVLRGANLVRATGVRGESAVEANHDRIREAVVSSLDDGRRRACAGRLARALEETGKADAEVLALLFRAAEEPARAASYAADAAEHAASALAFGRAASLYRLAIELRGGQQPAGHTLRKGLADALANAGRGEEAARAYLDAASTAPTDEAHVLRRRAAEELLRSGHIDEGLEVLGGVLSEVGLRLPRTPAAALSSLLYHRAKLRLRGTRYVLRAPGRDQEALLRRADAAWSVAAGLGLVDTIRGADFQARAMLYALEAGEQERLARAFAMAASFASSEAGTRARAAEHLAAAEALARLTEDPYTHAWMPLMRAMLAFSEGRFRDALTDALDALARFRGRCNGATWEITSAQSVAFWSLGYLGELRELSERVDALLREAMDRGDRYAAVNVRTGAAHLTRLAADDPEASRGESARAIREWSHRVFTLQHVFDLFTQAETLLYEERAEEALAYLRERWRDLARSLLPRVQTVRIFTLDLRSRIELACAARTGRLRRRVLLRSCERSADELDAQGLLWATAMAAALRAGIKRLREQPDARAALERAASTFRVAEMASHAAAAELVLGRLEGGEAGAARALRAEAWMSSQGIVSPGRWTRMLLPCFA